MFFKYLFIYSAFIKIIVIVQYTIGTLCVNMRYNGVKGTDPIVGGSEGGQSPTFLIHIWVNYYKLLFYFGI